MNPNDISKLIDQKIQAAAASGQFNLNRIPFHTHNGKDSPFIFLPTVVYAGVINSNGTLSRVEPFPSGWKLLYAGAGTGNYQITHNLNTTFYVVNVTPLAPATPAVALINNPLANSFEVHIFDSKTQATLDSNFFLTVTAVTNSKAGWPLYNKNAT